MATIDLLNAKGERVSELQLKDSIFNVKVNEIAMTDTVLRQLAKRRAGSACTKTRGLVRGGGRKPWRQKGTGRARAGSNRSPIWVGGGVIFGSKPRQYGFKINKKVRKLALKSALTLKARENDLIVVEKVDFNKPRTKLGKEFLASLKLDNVSVLVVDKEPSINALLALRNLKDVKVLKLEHLNLHDILKHEKLLLTKEALSCIEEVLENGK